MTYRACGIGSVIIHKSGFTERPVRDTPLWIMKAGETPRRINSAGPGNGARSPERGFPLPEGRHRRVSGR